MAADIRALVQRFEPLLHFHKDERFFPSDAKRYMEHSELWSAVGDLAANRGVQRTLKDNWGSSVGDHRSPLHPHPPTVAHRRPEGRSAAPGPAGWCGLPLRSAVPV